MKRLARWTNVNADHDGMNDWRRMGRINEPFFSFTCSYSWSGWFGGWMAGLDFGWEKISCLGLTRVLHFLELGIPKPAVLESVP